MSPLNQRFPGDSRPHVEVLLNGVSVDFLIATGTSLSVISEEIYKSIPNHQSLKSAPVETGLKLSAASGHLIKIVGCFKFHLRFRFRFRFLFHIYSSVQSIVLLPFHHS